MADFYRGTTPTIQLNVSADLRDATALWLTVEDDYGHAFTVTKTRLTVTETTVSAKLTQAETLSLVAGGVKIQLRALLSGSAAATDILGAELGNILREGAIVDG